MKKSQLFYLLSITLSLGSSSLGMEPESTHMEAEPTNSIEKMSILSAFPLIEKLPALQKVNLPYHVSYTNAGYKKDIKYKERLNLEQQDPISLATFRETYQEQASHGLPMLFCRVITEIETQNEETKKSEIKSVINHCSIDTLKWIYGKDFPERIEALKPQKNPGTSSDPKGPIDVYLIKTGTNPLQANIDYVGSDLDMIRGQKRIQDIVTLSKAKSDDETPDNIVAAAFALLNDKDNFIRSTAGLLYGSYLIKRGKKYQENDRLTTGIATLKTVAHTPEGSNPYAQVKAQFNLFKHFFTLRGENDLKEVVEMAQLLADQEYNLVLRARGMGRLADNLRLGIGGVSKDPERSMKLSQELADGRPFSPMKKAKGSLHVAENTNDPEVRRRYLEQTLSLASNDNGYTPYQTNEAKILKRAARRLSDELTLQTPPQTTNKTTPHTTKKKKKKKITSDSQISPK